jgi:hypothetical protein
VLSLYGCRVLFILMFKKLAILSLIAIPIAACAYPAINEIQEPEAPVEEKIEEKKIVQLEVDDDKTWKCPGCNENEKYVLEQLQQKTKISDKNALATLMGNIKSESGFVPNICEGGARVTYDKCYAGGYGLIQWTSTGRYRGLGTFCNKYDCDPSSLEGQVRYMINESQFQKVLPEFEGSGWTVAQYMVPSYYWLGWGIKGYRQEYAYDYTKKLVWS